MSKEAETVCTDKYEIPVWRKYTLSVQEAAKYFRIGDKKLKKLIDENPNASSFSGMDHALRLSGNYLSSSLTKNYLPYKRKKYTMDLEPGLWYDRCVS